MYHASFAEAWPGLFDALEPMIQDRVAKKIEKILEYPEKRHLHRSDYFVDEIGSYRIVYRVFNETAIVRFYGVFDHKAYEKWYHHITWILF